MEIFINLLFVSILLLLVHISTRQVATGGSSTDEEVLQDLGRNADLYIFNQDVNYAGLSFCLFQRRFDL